LASSLKKENKTSHMVFYQTHKTSLMASCQAQKASKGRLKGRLKECLKSTSQTKETRIRPPLTRGVNLPKIRGGKQLFLQYISSEGLLYVQEKSNFRESERHS
jgi:hypothetical protein